MSNGTGNQYSVVFINNSSQTWSACIYQRDPGIDNPDVMSLAWFANPAAPTTKIVFPWSDDYDFVWAETGTLLPGVVFEAAQTWAADLSGGNQVTFTSVGGAYTFQNQRQGPTPESLYITQDGTIPPGQASVGIGMSGAGTLVVQAQPNMNVAFTPDPEYWITFGNYVQGEVLDPASMSNQAQISFSPNVYSMTATLNADHSWTVVPTT